MYRPLESLKEKASMTGWLGIASSCLAFLAMYAGTL